MNRIALCIGNNSYSILPPLSCAVQDATAMAAKLSKLGFDTQLILNQNRADLLSNVFNFTAKIEDSDAAVIYYAGHGFQVEGDNLLAPTDLNIANPVKQVLLDALPLECLMHELNKYPDKPKVIILDACRDFFEDRGTSKGFAPMLVPRGTIIAFSTSPGQSAKENSSSGHGYYTEALLKYIDLSRVPVETVFKKTREFLAGNTSGTQISWEHTSLIGDFYFNPDTIYCGVSYGEDACADFSFTFESSFLKAIIDDLKTSNWDFQRSVITRLGDVNYLEARSSELFVLGRNIYQAADGNCYDAQRYIDRFASNTYTPVEAKVHLLNGMAYEIYFDSSNGIRQLIKNGKGYYQRIIECLEKDEFYGSRLFIIEHLRRVSDRPLYVPGQDKKMDFLIKIHVDSDGEHVDDIIYEGKSVYRDAENDVTTPDTTVWTREISYKELYRQVAEKAAAPIDRIRIQFAQTPTEGCPFLIPANGFVLRF